ncbi:MULTISPECIES: hypothetical protein [unclassified Actinotalea]|uniref:hypothetical protein n=1 Tax=unclassified Actinotalea TaxID=2638618 RepID=UPI0015F45418|nr:MULTISPECIES: hypothetical protein [unclassified Actinotalea]
MAPHLALHFDVTGDLRESALACEAEVFSAWYGNTREELDLEYGPYDDDSAFLVLAADDDVIGAVRLLAPGGAAGLKTLVELDREPWGVDGRRAAAAAGLDLSTTWEIATLGVRRDTKALSQHLGVALYHGLINVCRANGMSAYVAVLDERVRRMLTAVGLTSRALPGTRTAPYLGSAASTPVYTMCASTLDAQRRDLPDAYRLVTLGVGLDGVDVPPLTEFRLRRDRSASPERALLDPLTAEPLMA